MTTIVATARGSTGERRMRTGFAINAIMNKALAARR